MTSLEQQITRDIAYLELLVSKNILEQLSGAVTVLLETASQLDSLVETAAVPNVRRLVALNSSVCLTD